MKTVHWQVPFCSQEGTHYRIDIYASGDATPEVLIGGEDVFTTNEDDSTDYFCPVRTQTGTLRLVDTDGTLLDRIVPDNNLDHPIKLVNVDTNEVEWQGFLGCEAYSQTYTARTQILSLSVISVLEAMKSVELNSSIGTIMKVRNLLYTALQYIHTEGEGDIDLIRNVYYPDDSFNILFKYIDTAALFTIREIYNEDSVLYKVQGISAYEILERLCTYMGWTAHEVGQDIYLMKPACGLYFVGLNTLNVTGIHSDDNVFRRMQQNVAIQHENMSSLIYKGEDHRRSIYQGAKSVEVVANVPKYELNMRIPACPANDLTSYNVHLYTKYLYLLSFLSYVSPHSNVTLGYRYGDINPHTGTCYAVGNSNAFIMYEQLAIMLGANSSIAQSTKNPGNQYTFHSGAFFAKALVADEEKTNPDREDGLYCSFFPGIDSSDSFDISMVQPIVTIDNVLRYRAVSGYFCLNIDCSPIAVTNTHNPLIGTYIDTIVSSVFLHLTLQIGGDFWNGSEWQQTECDFMVKIVNGKIVGNWSSDMTIEETDGLLIPIGTTKAGIVRLKMWPHASNAGINANPIGMDIIFGEAFFRQIELTHIIPNNDRLSDRTQNTYRKVLGLNFKDEITIDCNLASNLSNYPSPSIILEDLTNTMKQLTYTYSSGNVEIRPEIELLKRMAVYYGANRRTVELEVQDKIKHGSDMEGYDGRTYIPAAISREWQRDKATVMMMEMPEAIK